LAAAIGAHSPALYRLLRALASLGVFAILDDGRFALMPLAEPLRTDVPGSLRALAQSALPGSRRARGSRAAQMRLVAGCVQR
jgi:hypothetical protein